MAKDLLLEIGTEEVPAHFMPGILAQLKEKATAKNLRSMRMKLMHPIRKSRPKDQADDRSEFAVQPGRKVGTTEQSDEKLSI